MFDLSGEKEPIEYDRGVTNEERERLELENRLRTLLSSRLPQRLVLAWASQAMPHVSVRIGDATFLSPRGTVTIAYVNDSNGTTSSFDL